MKKKFTNNTVNKSFNNSLSIIKEDIEESILNISLDSIVSKDILKKSL